jgi:hypothetical protein
MSAVVGDENEVLVDNWGGLRLGSGHQENEDGEEVLEVLPDHRGGGRSWWIDGAPVFFWKGELASLCGLAWRGGKKREGKS